jgi:hypothetical protein
MAQGNILDKALRALMIGVACFDLVAGFLLLVAPQFVSVMVKLPLPSELSYVCLLGILQIGLALAYLIGGLSPARHIGNVILAAVMRLAMGALVIFIGVTLDSWIFTLLGVAEIPIGLSHALYAIRLAPVGAIA